MIDVIEEEYQLAGNNTILADMVTGRQGYEMDVGSWSCQYYTMGIPRFHSDPVCCPSWLRDWDVSELAILKEHRRINQALRDRYIRIREIKSRAVWEQDDMDLINGLMRMNMHLIPPGNLLTLLTNGVIGSTPEDVQRFFYAASQNKDWSPNLRDWALNLWKNLHWFKGKVYITLTYPENVVLPTKQKILQLSKEIGTYSPQSGDTNIEMVRDLLYRIDVTGDVQSKRKLKSAVERWRWSGFLDNLP